nr:CHC2 zinc finger domain-containing protein [uncultured Blautia sp.]
MNIFQTVKENVTARQAAEQYGLKVNKNGMICCPFHDDRHPSMKVDKGFCCFACGAKGDVITFVADFFHLAPLEAAKKLAEDFQIPIFTDNTKKRNASKKKEKPKRTLYQTEKKFEEWERESIRILSDYLHLLKEWKVSHAPKMPDEEWKAEFIEACQQTEKINYYLDLLVFGELQDRIEFLLDSGKDVKRIEERMEEYRRNNKEQTGRSIESERNEL